MDEKGDEVPRGRASSVRRGVRAGKVLPKLTCAIAVCVALVVVVVLLVLLVLGGRTLRVSRLSCVRADFSRLPADDGPLESWLKAESGVVQHTVHIKREGKTIRVWFIMSQDIFNRPPHPDLAGACDSLGYSPRARLGL